VSYTPPQALYLSFGSHNHPARASSLNCCYGSGWFARLFWVMPCSIPPRLCFPVLVLPCTQKPVSDASLSRPIQVPSRNDGSFIFIFKSIQFAPCRARHVGRPSYLLRIHSVIREAVCSVIFIGLRTASRGAKLHVFVTTMSLQQGFAISIYVRFVFFRG
jgi:hypothetical protein